jgi:hypothetical protein
MTSYELTPVVLLLSWLVGGPPALEATRMVAPEISQYRGYDIVPTRQWSSWCVGIYPTRADLPILPRSILTTLALRKADAVAEAKYSIDRILSRLNSAAEEDRPWRLP